MFIHQSQLQHLLRPEQYYSEEQYRAEIRHLFNESWHPAASVRNLPKPGDFHTCELFETPVLIRNFDGELRAFLNVCPHRHSRLTNRPHGRAEKLRCQYHGWEFNKEGRTGQIPDAGAFRPWDRENACLRGFRLETCGEVVFICLSDSAPSLRDWLGPLWERWAPGFGGPYHYAATWQKHFDCNWKIVLENSLESYHIPMLHSKTFGEFPEESNCWHELEPEWSTFKTMIPSDWINRRQAWLVRRLGEPVTMEYGHHVRHPHITVATLDVSRILMCVYPTSPTTCRYWSLIYTLRGHRRNPLAWALAHFLRPIVISVSGRLFAEDGASMARCNAEWRQARIGASSARARNASTCSRNTSTRCAPARWNFPRQE